MRTQLARCAFLCGLLASVILGGSSGAARAEDSVDRPWYHHAELAATPGLRAEPHHVVILHLAPADPGGKSTLRNSVPYHFPETAPFNFCVPEDDPHIRGLTLAREGSPAVVVHVPRGAPCKTRTISAGRYRLHVDHDGTRVPAEGAKAFIHVPRQRALQASGAPAFPVTCDPDPYKDPLYTFTIPNGLFVSPIIIGRNSTDKVRAETPRALTLGWNICLQATGDVTITNRPSSGALLPALFFSPGPPSSDTAFYNYSTTGAPATRFRLTDLGNHQFTLTANFGGSFYPVVAGSDNILRWAPPGTTPTVFTIVLRYYLPTYFPATPLAQGETALFQYYCNYDNSLWGTPVVVTNIPDLSALVAVGATIDNVVASVKVGPQTTAILYRDTHYGGTAQVIAVDTSVPGRNLAREPGRIVRQGPADP